MFIKTVSTISGINPIKFDEAGGVFYWILNTGLSTVYASTKSAFTAGDDGVVSLGPKESRRLETNNDTIYILGAGQVEIHNQRDGICSFKQAPTSSGSGGGGTIDAYSKTESDAKYAQKTDIPTSLPANGGNADTVDGYHVDNLIHASENIPPEYITEFLRINGDTKSIERWSTNNLRVEFANNAAKAKDADTVGTMHVWTWGVLNDSGYFDSSDYLAARYNFYGDGRYGIISGSGAHVRCEYATNADTVDGLHANDFIKIVDFGYTETDTKTAIGQLGKTTIYRCTKWTDYPAEFIDSQGTLITVNYAGSGTVGTDPIWCTQIIVNPRSGNKMFIRYIDATSVSDWKEISTTPIKKISFSSLATNQGGGGSLFSATFGTPIIIACTSRADTQCTPFFTNNQWLVSAKDVATLDSIPAGSYSFDVWYI